MSGFERLENIIKEYGKVAVAFSGGVDSTFLVCFAGKVLGNENVIAVTAAAPNFAADEIEYAKNLCKKLGIEHRCEEIELPCLFWKNPEDRCYHCKKSIFSDIISKLPEGFVFCDGSNADDLKDYRPGSKAAKELGVRSPLEEAGLTKKEIRQGLKDMNISIWNKPAFACLASRIPYNTEITENMLAAVYALESMLKAEGFTQLRARLEGEKVRFELVTDEIGKLLGDETLLAILEAKAKEFGYREIEVDPRGYRMGSLNDAIKKGE